METKILELNPHVYFVLWERPEAYISAVGMLKSDSSISFLLASFIILIYEENVQHLKIWNLRKQVEKNYFGSITHSARNL